jgi:CheY-specific phosphatase CheX
MNPDLEKIITHVVADVIKTMAFMFAEPVDVRKMSETTWNTSGWIKTWMEFRGLLTGSLTICFPSELSRLIAANVLGVESSDKQAAIRGNDAVAELLNVICGHILTEFAGEEPVFDLTTPQTADIGLMEVTTLCGGDGDALAFLIESKPLFVTLILSESKA